VQGERTSAGGSRHACSAGVGRRWAEIGVGRRWAGTRPSMSI
jgi:hypothetical protein